VFSFVYTKQVSLVPFVSVFNDSYGLSIDRQHRPS